MSMSTIDNLPVTATDPVRPEDVPAPEPTRVPVDWSGVVIDVAMAVALVVGAAVVVSVMFAAM